MIGVKGQITLTPVCCMFSLFFQREISPSDLKTHLLPISPPHTRRTLPLIWPLTTGAPVPQPIDSLALNLNLGATETTIKGALSLSRRQIAGQTILVHFPLISPFIEWTTYPQLSWTFWPFSSCGMHAFPVYRRCPIYSDGSPDDNNLHTPLGVTRPVLVAGSKRGPSNYKE